MEDSSSSLVPGLPATHGDAPRELTTAGKVTVAALALYLIASLPGWLWVLADGATGRFRLLTLIGIQTVSDTEAVNLVKLAYFAAVGGAVGGVTFGMMNLQRHATVGSFRPVFAGDYLFRPFGASALALVVFALARGGVLTVLGVDAAAGSATIGARLSSLGIGFLVGFASVAVIRSLNGLAARTFGAERDGKA